MGEGVTLSPPTPTAFPFGTILLPAPPQPVEPLPDATNQPPPYDGWYSFESDNPSVQYSAPWSPRLQANASRGQYHRSENTTSFVSFPFEGEGLRIRYVAARNMGLFDVIVDGMVIDTIDAYAPELHFPAMRNTMNTEPTLESIRRGMLLRSVGVLIAPFMLMLAALACAGTPLSAVPVYTCPTAIPQPTATVLPGTAIPIPLPLPTPYQITPPQDFYVGDAIFK